MVFKVTLAPTPSKFALNPSLNVVVLKNGQIHFHVFFFVCFSVFSLLNCCTLGLLTIILAPEDSKLQSTSKQLELDFNKQT